MKELPLPEVKELEQEPINQFHAQMLNLTDKPPVSEVIWKGGGGGSLSYDNCIKYDWTNTEYSR